MKLILEEVRQGKDLGCGIACTSMILKYYNINKSYEELKKEIKIYENVGTYIPQLGIYFLNQGLKTEIITLNPYIFTKNDMKKTQKELLNLVNKLLKDSKKQKFKVSLNYYKKYLELGGKIKIKIPDEKDIKRSISKKQPLIAGLTTNFLILKEPRFNLHYNVVTGIDEKNVYALDPRADEYGGKQKISIKEYIYGIHATTHADADNCSLMVVKK